MKNLQKFRQKTWVAVAPKANFCRGLRPYAPIPKKTSPTVDDMNPALLIIRNIL